MKKSRYLLLIFCLFATIWQACETEKETIPGSIYGVVADKATGEPIKSAGVELTPSGLKTITGSEGQFEFTKLDPGKYTLLVTKTGYLDGVSSTIEVKPGQQVKGDVQIEKLPPALKVVDENNADLLEIHFGNAEADIARSFNIYNDGAEKLSWEIVKTAIWIDSISKTSGDVLPNGKQPIVVTIDRNKLEEGENKTTLPITSSNGSKSLTVIAVNSRKALSLNTLECTDIKGTTAIFNAELLCEGNPKYTERGFVYSTTQQPTVDNTIAKLTVPVDDKLQFSAQAVDLAANTTYYVRAYAISVLGTFYSTNQVSFVVQTSAPSVVTDSIKDLNIEKGTAIFNGKVTYVGDPAYTERGFVYGLVPNPTIDDTKKVVSGTGEGAFSANITGLEEGNTYYVRAYAQNVKGVAYGKDVIVNCVATMPEVVTNEVTNISIKNGTATFVCEVKSYGDLTCEERGFVYALTNNPTIDDTKLTVSGAELGVFRKNVSGLEEGKTYYVRAYVTNAKGTVYGNEVSCNFTATMPVVKTLAATNKEIAKGTATFNGTVVSLGDLGYTERGFAYATVHNPTVSDNKVMAKGSGTGEFSVTATQLEEGKTYYICAYVTNSKGTVYGEEIEINYTAEMPEVKTLEVINKNFGAGTATFKGDIVSLGDLGYTERGFVYTTVHNPTIDDSKAIAEGSGTGEFSATATLLKEGKTYYIRAYATNCKSTVYGEEIEMDYTAAMPIVKTVSIVSKNIADKVATFKGEVISLGDLACIERGFVYSTTNTPTIDNNKIIASGTGTGTFTATASQLQESETYYVRAFVTNKKGTVYGEEKTFTMQVVPTVKTFAATNITLSTATVEGNVTDDGGAEVTERGVVYSTSQNPTTENTKVIKGSGMGAYTCNLIDLLEGATYYVRAYATNSQGTAYGEQYSFTTLSYTSPSVTTSPITDITYTSAMAWGYVTSDGGAAVTERGVVYNTLQNPTITNTKVANGHGVGSFSCSLSNLKAGTKYYVRAYAINSLNIAYGEQYSFTTKAYSTPSVTTTSTTDITYTSAIAWGIVTNDGGTAVIERGVVYSTSEYPTTRDAKVTNGNGIGSFSCNLSNLNDGTTYYIRAYAINSQGTAYGEQYSFTTNSYLTPTVMTSPVTDIAYTSAIAWGYVTSDGGTSVTERGIVYSTSEEPTLSNGNIILSGGGVGSFSCHLVNLNEGVTYYVRAYATNNEGTAYGEQQHFTTASTIGVENGYMYIDLGLSVKWATCNIGASCPEAHGYYFAWGETQSKSTYTWNNYKYCYDSREKLTKYCDYSNYGYNGFTDNKVTLDGSDDAACVIWRGSWRMPTDAECKELMEQCTWTWTAQNNIKGYKVTSKTNGNSIFLPAVGGYDGSEHVSSNTNGFYWSKSMGDSWPWLAYRMQFSSSNKGKYDYEDRYVGHPIRPVCP